MTDTPDAPQSFGQRIELGLKSLGAIHPSDALRGVRPPTVVVERLDTVKKWAEAMVRAETARELDVWIARLERQPSTAVLDAAVVLAALRQRAEDLRTGAVTP